MRQDTTNSQLVNSDGLLTIKEVALQLKISRHTLWKLTKEKGIETLKVGGSVRYTADAVAKLIQVA